jgi:3-methyladenine DNA glycosylase AlkD
MSKICLTIFIKLVHTSVPSPQKPAKVILLEYYKPYYTIFIMNAKTETAVKKLKSMANPKNVEGMARFGINPKNTLGVSIPFIRKLGKELGKDHRLAGELWETGIHEARILASLVEEPEKITSSQMDKWAADFDSWDVCDQVCMNLFDRTPFAYRKIVQWSGRREEFVRRAAFSLIASLACHDKAAKDAVFEKLLPVIKKASTDERNFVRKAVNWALRGVGKRNRKLNAKALETAREIAAMDSKAAKWIAKDAIREFESPAVRKRLGF